LGVVGGRWRGVKEIKCSKMGRKFRTFWEFGGLETVGGPWNPFLQAFIQAFLRQCVGGGCVCVI
jgi:hypothetical protein